MNLLRSAGSCVDGGMETRSPSSRKRAPAEAPAALRRGSPTTLAALNALIAADDPSGPGSTRPVPGEGPLSPALALVGEQPGDQEDLQGRPFVGPAGRLLTQALDDARIDRGACYLTNAVKRFKFTARGKRRLHRKPTAGEVRHDRWWLSKELEIVRPRLVVALGATAVLALAGKALPVTASRGPADFDGRAGFITVHPSYLLRIPDDTAKRAAYAAFVADLKAAAAIARSASAA